MYDKWGGVQNLPKGRSKSLLYENRPYKSPAKSVLHYSKFCKNNFAEFFEGWMANNKHFANFNPGFWENKRKLAQKFWFTLVTKLWIVLDCIFSLINLFSAFSSLSQCLPPSVKAKLKRFSPNHPPLIKHTAPFKTTWTKKKKNRNICAIKTGNWSYKIAPIK